MSSIVIEYRTRKTHCHCCEQELPKPKTTDVKLFELSEKNLMENRRHWVEVAEFEEDFEATVSDYVYETLYDFAVNSYDRLIIENSEFKKVEKFIKDKVIG